MGHHHATHSTWIGPLILNAHLTQTHDLLERYLTHQEWQRATHTIGSSVAASCVGVPKSVALQSCKRVFKHAQVPFPHSISSYRKLHNTDFEYAVSLAASLQTKSKPATPPSPIETRPPFSRAVNAHTQQNSVSVRRSYRPLQPFSLALSASFLQQGRTMVATVNFKCGCIKCVAMDPPPFGAQPHVPAPPTQWPIWIYA